MITIQSMTYETMSRIEKAAAISLFAIKAQYQICKQSGVSFSLKEISIVKETSGFIVTL